MYNFKYSHRIGCVGIVKNNQVTAVSLLENIENNTICIWNIEHGDYESGSLLIKAFALNNDTFRIRYDSRLDDRWKIAFSYFI